MIARHSIRGRRELSYVATSDCVATLIAFAVIAARLHDRNFSDTVLLLTHVGLHTFTCILQLIALKFTIITSNPLHLLRVFYVLFFFVDVACLGGFLYVYSKQESGAAGSFDDAYVTLRVLLSVAFVFVDFCGWFFANLAFNYIDSLSFADNGAYMYTTSANVMQTNNFTVAPNGRVASVRLTPPTRQQVNGAGSA